MAKSDELERIKKLYGENFMHFCKRAFPTILEQEGVLLKILEANFATNSNTLFYDIIKYKRESTFINFIYGIFKQMEAKEDKPKIDTNKTPEELLKEAGYTLYKCTTEKQIQSFKKYYAPTEELCTFWGNRLKRCVVFFAVRKDAKRIRRKNFKTPKREDRYSTSVLSIQFTRDAPCVVSIKSRYNSGVPNPDATFGNDLDRIVPGLTKSFAQHLEKKEGLSLDSLSIENFQDLYDSFVDSFKRINYKVASDGKFYKYNKEINGIYYCPGNIIIKDGEIIHLEPEKQELLDYFILDKEKKTLTVFDSNLKDSFTDSFENIDKIEIYKDKKTGIRTITIYQKQKEKPIIIKTDKSNQIVEYTNEYLTEVGDDFLVYNNTLVKMETPNGLIIGEEFFEEHKELFPYNLEINGIYYGPGNKIIDHGKVIQLDPEKQELLDYFILDKENKTLTVFDPNLKDSFVDDFENIDKIQTDLDEKTGYKTITIYQKQREKPIIIKTNRNNQIVEYTNENLTEVGDDFLSYNKKLKRIWTPNIIEVGDNCLKNNEDLETVYFPFLKRTGNDFIYTNKKISAVDFSSLVTTGDEFLYWNEGLKELFVPNAINFGNCFCVANSRLFNLYAPQVKNMGRSCFESNTGLKRIDLPAVEKMGNQCFLYNKKMTYINIPNVVEIGDTCFYSNKRLRKLYLPQATDVGEGFLEQNRSLYSVYIPKRPDLEKEIMGRKKKISARILARLDFMSKMTKSDISFGKEVIDKITGRSKEEHREE